ncbi:MAG: TAT-variant-translocated molybdopterin oxidoreductase, partial [Bdellovibrionaceae bacterium]|nr:TAT-variant-translocated molybdopterin oxidoreductase [Pseudobdellovibrionaceae bacterium]
MSETHHEHSEAELAAKKAARPQIQRDNKYWLSLEHYAQDPEFLKLAETEFQSSPLRETDGKDGGWARREFLKLMGASLAMASTGCLRRPIQKIVPYNKAPEEVTLGVSNFYTGAWADGSEPVALLVKTREGRPIKMEGNPSHPLTKGGTSARIQASILSLYDPERLQGPKKNLFNEKRTNKDTIGVSWDALDEAVVAQLNKGGVRILTGFVHSPATRALIGDFASAFKAQHVVWAPLAHDDLLDGQAAAFGEATVPFYRFDRAKMIVSVDADFLGTWLMPVTFTRQFAEGRKNPETMSRLVSFDSTMSLTAANADIRYRIKPSQQVAVVLGLAHEIVVKSGRSSFAGNATVRGLLSAYANVAQQLGVDPSDFAKVANDLWQNRGEALVVAGGLAARTEDARSLQIAVNFLNSVLEAEGKTVLGRSASSALTGGYSDLEKLIAEMNSGAVKTLIIHGVNPAYALPTSAGFVEALKKVEMVIYTGDRID